jgi:transposase
VEGRREGAAGGVSEREIVLTDGEGFSPDDVAMRYRLTATMVRRWRVQDKRDGETGVPLAKVRERVRALRDAGKSYRAIGQELGRSKSQVERVDKAA